MKHVRGSSPSRAPGILAMTAATFLLALMAAGVLALAPRSASAAPPEPCSTAEAQLEQGFISHDPSVSVNPAKGPSGSSAQLHIWNFLPNQAVSAIFRSAGDPVVASGTVDAGGEAYLTFTVPQAPDGVYWVLVAQENRTCVHAAVHFTIGQVPPPTPTQPPPTATPTRPASPTVTLTAAPSTPVATPTIAPPVAGSGNGSGGPGGANSGLVVLALAMATAGFGILGVAYGRKASQR